MFVRDSARAESILPREVDLVVGDFGTPLRSRRLVVQLSALRARPGSPLPGQDWTGRVEEHLQDDQLTGRVLDRTSTTEARCQSDAAIATPIKAAPRPARRLRATFAAARKREPSSASRSVSYPKVL